MARRTIDDLLAEARHGLERLTAVGARAALGAGAVLVDTRSDDQRRAQGYVPGAVHHPLSVLYWRLDPDFPTGNAKLPLDAQIVLICRDGYSSSIAAAQLQELGFARATDVIDGVEGWKAAGLPLVREADLPVGDADETVADERFDDVAVELP
jgi:rhodanese-related sulfurtransferase